MDSLWKDFINTGSVEAYLRYRRAAENADLKNKREVRNGL